MIVRKEALIRGLRTAWLEGGPDAAVADVPIIMFVHGFPDQAEDWQAQLIHFAAGAKVVAPYVRGTLPSERPSDDSGVGLGRYSPNGVALDLFEILSQVGGAPIGQGSQKGQKDQKVVVVGHDLGAAHAWHFARLLGRRAAGLVILNGMTIGQFTRRLRRPSQWLRCWYMAVFQVPGISERLLSSLGPRVRALTHGREQGKELIKDIAGMPLPLATPYDPVGPMHQYRAFLRDMPTAIRERPHRLGCPVLAIFGDHDPYLLVPSVQELQPEARDLTVRILNGGHWLHHEMPTTINRYLANFLAEATGRDAR